MFPQPRLKVPEIRLTTDNAEVARGSDAVFFALKVPVTLGVVRSLSHLLEGKLCVSLASSVTLSMLKEAAPGARWARAMSNVCAALNCAMTGISCSDDVPAAEASWLEDLFSLCGEVDMNPPYDLDVMTSVAGAGPAFALEMIEAMAMGGIQIGIPKGSAYKMAASAALGAARLILERGAHPAQLRDDVCSPGGMTIEGISILEQGARGAMMRAIVETAKKNAVLVEKAKKQT
jgi:pyrroline-5-carboxylate reductase